VSDAIPATVCLGIETALGPGDGGRVESHRPVGGGCIHHAAAIRTRDGRRFFLKWSADTPAGMFDAEADGLAALAATRTARVPLPVAWSDGNPAEPGWIVMDLVPPGDVREPRGSALGAAVAALHSTRVDPSFGWGRDNWIGLLPQPNRERPGWGAFWREARLAPQLDRARDAGLLRDTSLDEVLELTDSALTHVRTPSLLHGDLWHGNAYTAMSGEPVLVDPAVYRGDPEVDLAMSELFGGFSPGFYGAYRAVRPPGPAYDAYLRDLYQLYYLLVHVNLFGAGYEAATLAAARRVLAAWR